MRTALVAATVVVLILGMLTGAWAASAGEKVLYGSYEDVPAVGWWPANASGIIGVGGIEFFSIPANGGGLPLAMRCEIVDARITEILSAHVSGPVHVGAVRGQPTVYVGAYRLITAYDEDAVNAGAASAQALAEKWAQGLAASLAQVVPGALKPLPAANPAPGPPVT